MNTKQMIEEAANEIWNAGGKLTHNQIDKILTTLLTKHEAAVLEREAQWCESQIVEFGGNDKIINMVLNATNRELQSTADHLRKHQSSNTDNL